MEKSKKRALRRFHDARMLKHAKRVIDSWYWCAEDREREKHLFHLWARQQRDNMQVCSCAMCGNPRRGYWNGKERLTIAERKNEESFRDQLNEINELYC